MCKKQSQGFISYLIGLDNNNESKHRISSIQRGGLTSWESRYTSSVMV